MSITDGIPGVVTCQITLWNIILSFDSLSSLQFLLNEKTYHIHRSK